MASPLNAYRLDQTWLKQDRLDRDMADPRIDTPENQADYARTLDHLDSVAVSAMRTEQALDRALQDPRLKGDPALANALKSLQQDPYTQYAILRSDSVAREVAFQAMSHKEGGGAKGTMKGGVQGIVATNPSVLPDWEMFKGEDGKSLTPFNVTYTDVSGKTTKLDARKVLGFNIFPNTAGGIIYADQFMDHAQAFIDHPNVYDGAKSIYAGFGFAKEVSETLAIAVQKGAPLQWLMPEKISASVLASSQRAGMWNFGAVANDPLNVKVARRLYWASAVFDAYNFVKYSRHGDFFGAGWSATSASGGVIGALASTADKVKEVRMYRWGGAIAAGLQLTAAVGLDYHTAWHNEALDRKFLDVDGINPEVGAKLALSDREHRSAGPILAAMEKQEGIDPEKLRDFFNSLTSEKDLRKLDYFIERARRVPPTENGYPPKAENDDRLKPFPYWYTRVLTTHPWRSDSDEEPRSVRGVRNMGVLLWGNKIPLASQQPVRRRR